MNAIEFKHLIKNANYYTKYEPILDKESLDIYGYEALSKFDIDQNIINTEEIFRKLHHNNKLFFELEKRNKILQVENFQFKDKKLFLNFDADIFVTDNQQSYWEEFLLKYKKYLIVEITENGSDDEVSALIMKKFSSWLNSKEILSALDDFGKDGTMFSFNMMNNSKFIKIDKSFLEQIRVNPNYKNYLNGILKTVKLNNQKSIIEGIETIDDLNLVRDLECDYVQGYFFSDLVKIV